MNDKTTTSWENFLNPEILKRRLLAASMYISAYEVLKNSIIERIREFYTFGDTFPDSKYESEVLTLNPNKSPLYSSLKWLQNSNAVDSNDLTNFEELKKCRNTMTHRLFEKIARDDLPDLASLFEIMISLLRKIEVWWIVEFEIPTNPDYDGIVVNESEIIPGPLLTLRMMFDIALCEGERSSHYFNEFKKQKANKTLGENSEPLRVSESSS
jgi:hypothetical protein